MKVDCESVGVASHSAIHNSITLLTIAEAADFGNWKNNEIPPLISNLLPF